MKIGKSGKQENRKKRLHKGIYILPNIFTSLNIFCGYYSVISSLDRNFVAAAVAIIIAAVFDTLDGKIARATNTTSKFGIEYDSLADIISFGFAPGLMIYLWALEPLGRIGWLAAFLFLVCGALRLARFNAQASNSPSTYFTGLPIPAAAGMNATMVLFLHRIEIFEANPVFLLVFLYFLSFLMVSTIKYESLKRPELLKRMKFNNLVVVILVLIFIAAEPSVTLFILAVAYTISGLINFVRQKKSEACDIEELNSDDIFMGLKK